MGLLVYAVYMFYISFRFARLAKKYDKNVAIWSVLSLIFYIVTIAFVGLSLFLFSSLKLIPSIEKMDPMHMVIIEVFTFAFVAFGLYSVVEKFFKKDVKIAEIEREDKKQVMENSKPKFDFYYHFHRVNESNIHHIKPLAEKIWSVTYGKILTQEQIDYMIPMMYSNEKIMSEIEQDYQWELLKIDNITVGYLDYKLEGNQRVFLSKIYVDTDVQQKGIGKLMLQHVMEFAYKQNAKAIYLTVNKNNTKAIQFYERNNFKQIKSETFDIGNGFVMDDYIYQLDL